MKRMICVFAAALLLTGCAENPETSIIVHKDMENVIREAEQTDEHKADVEQLRQYDSYTADIEDESLRVKVHADAEVDIPQTDKLSVFRVKQHEFTQEEVDRFRKALMGDVPLCDGSKLKAKTKAMLEEEIGELRAEVNRMRAENDPETAEQYAKEYQIEIDKLQAEYEAAPEQIDLSGYPADGKLASVESLLKRDPDSEYWQWQQNLNPDGTVSYVCSADGNTAFYVQNNNKYSNNIVFSTSPVGAECMTVLGGETDTEELTADYPDAPEHFLPNGIALDDECCDYSYIFEPIPGDSASLTQEEAQAKAEAFLHSMGLDDFALYQGGKYAKWLDLYHESLGEPRTLQYRTAWILTYYRGIDGVFLEQNSGAKFATYYQGEYYTKKIWPGEVIQIEINDTGIVGFSWNAPLEITETVVEDAALKPFSEISSTFERMMPMVAAPADEYEEPAKITVDRVTLSYSRISEKDSFDTGLVIPVWGFIGEQKGGRLPFKGVQMAINAIDGSVIDADLGY